MSDSLVEQVRLSLLRVQQFDVRSLAQTGRLGSELNFEEAVQPASRIANLFRQIPDQYLSEFPDTHLNDIRNESNSFYNLLEEITKFDVSSSDAFGRRQNYINTMNQNYTNYFNKLNSVISYGSSRLKDYSALERDARSAMQAAKDRAEEIAQVLDVHRADAERILSDVRKTAAEQGVSQQAVYFRDESINHEEEATTWQKRTLIVAESLVIYAAFSAFLHKLDFIKPENMYETIQLGISKFLIFSVIAYILFLCAKNFLSHKHNSVVNKHRQNALLTFKALTDAALGEERRDIVLTYAAACIFSPQDTGYIKPGSNNELPSNIIQSIPKISSSSSQTGA